MSEIPLLPSLSLPVLATWGASVLGSIFIGWALTAAVLTIAKAPRPRMPPSPIPVLNAPPDAAREVMRGGRVIGILERTIITTAIFFGAETIVAVTLAIKGLGRYPELRAAPAVSERFIIGTFVSVATAIIIGLVGRQILVSFAITSI
ncbi:MAG: hypothetical protein Q4Q03_03450 [Bowdeniella nasicola]|nr:hypothetical protein [Bowdeniella nasicola]